MQMPMLRLHSLFLVSLCAPGLLFATLVGGPGRLPALAKSADVIAVGTATALSAGQSETTVTLTLAIASVVKGQPGLASLQAAADLPPVPTQSTSPDKVDIAALQTAVVGSSGIWFLQLGPAGYHVIPTVNGWYNPQDWRFPLDPQTLSLNPTGTVNQKLLAYLVRWYLELPDPASTGDFWLFPSFAKGFPGMEDVDTQDLLTAAGALVASPAVTPHFTGLVLSVQLGSDTALSEALSEIDRLKTNPKFNSLTQAISFFPHDAAAIPILLQEIAFHTDAPGLDDAVASALTKMIGNRAVPPAMAALLMNSPDPGAQLRAAWFFSVYIMLCDAQGNVKEGNPDGPYATPEARSFAPGIPGKTPEQIVQFWQQWWTENAAKLGYPAP